jgi:hypothetical protein
MLVIFAGTIAHAGDFADPYDGSNFSFDHCKRRRKNPSRVAAG